MNNTEYVIIYVTTANLAEAQRIAGALLEERLVACVNTVPGIQSRYWWKGQLEEAAEHLLIMKTRASHLDAVIVRVKMLHSYEVPQVVAVPIVGGSPAYMQWIGDSVRP